MATKCSYCGNASGKTDNRGQCVSCGAPLHTATPTDLFLTERILVSDKYIGASGGYCSAPFLFGESGAETLTFAPVALSRSLTVDKKIINIVRKAAGLWQT